MTDPYTPDERRTRGHEPQVKPGPTGAYAPSYGSGRGSAQPKHQGMSQRDEVRQPTAPIPPMYVARTPVAPTPVPRRRHAALFVTVTAALFFLAQAIGLYAGYASEHGGYPNGGWLTVWMSGGGAVLLVLSVLVVAAVSAWYFGLFDRLRGRSTTSTGTGTGERPHRPGR